MEPNFVWSEVNQDWIDVNYATQDAAATGNWGGLNDLITSLGTGAKDIVTALNSFELQQLNLERARKGLAPLNPAQYAPQVGLNLSAGTMNTIMLAALGLGAVMLLHRR